MCVERVEQGTQDTALLYTAHIYTQRYGLKEHFLILDVDFSCSEVHCQTATANESQVFEY